MGSIGLGTAPLAFKAISFDDSIAVVRAAIDAGAKFIELQLAGEIHHIGLSNVSIEQVEQARTVAPITAAQNRLAYGDRGDLPTARYCAARAIAYLAYMPLGGSRRALPSPTIDVIAEKHGVSSQRVRLAWLLAREMPILPQWAQHCRHRRTASPGNT